MEMASAINNFDYSKLPQNVLTSILQYIDFCELQTVARTCQSWYTASVDPIVTKNKWVKISSRDSLEDALQTIITPIRNLILRPDNLEIVHLVQFFRQFGQHIIELHVWEGVIPFECFAYLENLSTLQLFGAAVSHVNFHEADGIKTIIGKNLTRIKFVRARMELEQPDTYQEYFIRLLAGISSLNKLIISASSVNQATELYKKLFVTMNDWDEINLEELDLNLSRDKIDADFFQSFGNITKPINIYKLRIGRIDQSYYDENFRIFCQRLSSVRILAVESLNEGHLIDICHYMNALKELHLSNLSCRNYQIIGNLRHLEKMSISYHFAAGLSVHLAERELIGMFFTRFENLIEFSTSLPISRAVLNALCQNCINLEKLELRYLATKNVRAIYRYLIHLKQLTINIRLWAYNEGTFDDDYNITNLKSLEILNISEFLPGMTQELIDLLPNLKKFILSM